MLRRPGHRHADSAGVALGPARLVREPVASDLAPAAAVLTLRGDARPFALLGDWAGGRAILGSEPVRVLEAGEDAFAALDDLPGAVEGGTRDAVGGGWFGWLGYALGHVVERLPPDPPRPEPRRVAGLAWYDHVLRQDASGRWWFEALWTDARDAALHERLAVLRGRMAAAPLARPFALGAFGVRAPGTAGHAEAVAQCVERIAAGELFQANLALRLDAGWRGDPLDLFATAASALQPAAAAFFRDGDGAVVSLSPELFLRRRGRQVVTQPIKGTTAGPSAEARARLRASAKDRAENTMIVDLMRNDLGRVCAYGSVRVEVLAEAHEGPGVWHLVSRVSGTLRAGVGDADLLRAAFPPGSVTGAPKVHAMKVIAELEATGREAYTGAAGFGSPLAGLQLNVAIRTLEVRGDRAWLQAGGGIVADSLPAAEVAECLTKAAPIVAAAGSRIVSELRAGGGGLRAGAATEGGGPSLARVLDGGRARPDPARGVFETLLVCDGSAVAAADHLARLGASVLALYGSVLPHRLADRVAAAAARLAGCHRLRVTATPAVDGPLEIGLTHAPLDADALTAPVLLTPLQLPGGLGAHKWQDRDALDEAAPPGTTPLLVDLDCDVLEAAWANVAIAEGEALVTPTADGRLLPGTTRTRLLALGAITAAPVSLARLRAADAVLLTSALRGAVPAAIAPARPARRAFTIAAGLRSALGM